MFTFNSLLLLTQIVYVILCYCQRKLFFSPILKSLKQQTCKKKPEGQKLFWIGCYESCDLVMTSCLSHFQETMRIPYTFHRNLKIQTRQFQALFFTWIFLKFRMQVEKIITEFKYTTRFHKYLPEVVNFGPAFDITNTILGKIGPKFIILQQIEFEAWKLAPRWILSWRIHCWGHFSTFLKCDLTDEFSIIKFKLLTLINKLFVK